MRLHFESKPISYKEIFSALFISMIICAIFALKLGQDTNWDWRNYHQYSGYAILYNKYDIDIAPAGIQSYFNPYVYVFIYLIKTHLPLGVGLAIIGALQGLNLAVIWFLSRHLFTPAQGLWPVLVSTLIATFSPMAMSEIGTSMIDIWLSPLVLLALMLVILGTHEDGKPTRSFTLLILAGGLSAGIAVGFKLTNIGFAIGLWAAVLFGPRRYYGTLLLAAGGLAGYLISSGFWSFYLWQTFGNPVFPYYNAIFGSPDGPAFNLKDIRFLPANTPQMLAYPVLWALGDHRSAELVFYDVRFLLVMVLGLILCGAALASRRLPLSRRQAQVVIFFLVSYLIWIKTFAIQRYIVPLELLSGPLIAILTWAIPGRAARIALAAAACALTINVNRPPDWGRLPRGVNYAFDTPAALHKPATYFLTGKPLAFVAARLPAESRFFMVGDPDILVATGPVFSQRIAHARAHPLPGGEWVIRQREESEIQSNDKLKPFGYQVDTTAPCVSLGQLGDSDVEACPLKSISS